MDINRENYEIFFLDYYEGAISEEAKLQLIAFLEVNPDLKEEFESFENICITDTSNSITFDFKESLKKQNTTTLINATNYHEFFIADTEGDLLPAQKKQLDVFLSQNTHLFNDYQLYKSIKLVPDQSIVYQQKAALKRFVIFGLPLHKKIIYQTASVAASLLLIASVSLSYFNNTTIEKPIANISSNKLVNNIINKNTIIKPKESVLKIANTIAKTNDNQKNAASSEKEFSKIQANAEIARDFTRINALSSKEIQQLANVKTEMASTYDNRTYYTSLVDLIAFSDENIKKENIETSPDSFKNTILNSDLIKNQPIAEAGSFLKNAAIVGLSKIESLSSDIKDTYLAVEKRFERK